MNHRPSLLDPVALRVAVPEHGLVEGQVGTVVEELEPAVFEVEFSNDRGECYALAALPAESLITLHFSPAAA